MAVRWMTDGRRSCSEASFGGRGVRAVEEDEQAGAVPLIASLQSASVGGVRLVGREGPDDEPVDGVVDAASTLALA